MIDIGPIGGGNIWIDGLQIYLLSANGNGQDAINIDQTTNYADHRISNNIIRAGPITASAVYGIYAKDALGSYVVRIWNNIIYGFNGQANNTAIYSDGDYGATFTIYAYNNTVYDCQRGYYKNGAAAGPFILKNNIAYNNTDNYDAAGSTFDGSSTNNLSGPGADAQMPATAARNGVAVTFVLPGGSPANLHLAPGDAGAQNFGAILSSDPNLAVLNDIDGQVRQVAWDIGADDANGTTAVKLMSFEARPLDSANSLTWQTGSELDNLGFHVYRALSADGPWTRISASLIPGLGSSAVGPSVLVPRRRSHERRALLLPPGRRGRVVEDDVSRPGLGGAAGGGCGRCAGERGSRGESKREEERVLGVMPGVGARGLRVLGGLRGGDGVLALHAARGSRGRLTGRRRA